MLKGQMSLFQIVQYVYISFSNLIYYSYDRFWVQIQHILLSKELIHQYFRMDKIMKFSSVGNCFAQFLRLFFCILVLYQKSGDPPWLSLALQKHFAQYTFWFEQQFYEICFCYLSLNGSRRIKNKVKRANFGVQIYFFEMGL